jgi:hypothetical protein
MRPSSLTLPAALALLAVTASAANQPPDIDHTTFACTVANHAISLCATITDDTQVAKARIFFKRGGETFFSFVDMAFGGMNFCGVIPAPLEGKVRLVQYYIQAIDDQFESQRTSTYDLQVMVEGACEFPPIVKDKDRPPSITVYATNQKQGKKVPDGFDSTGVTFVPIKK